MSYSYSTPLNYGQTAPLTYSGVENGQVVQRRSSSSAPVAVAGAAAGGIAGGIIGGAINPYFKKNNDDKDTFTHKVYEKYAKNGPQEVKDFYEQSKKVLKDIKGAKNADEIRNILNNNAEVKKIISDDLISGMTDGNMVSNKNSIIRTIEAKNNENVQTIRNSIQKCWNAAEKKWEKPAGINDDVYKSISKVKNWMVAENVFKGIGIGVVTAGLAAYAAHKLYTHHKESAQQ